MADISRDEYTEEERVRYDGAFDRLRKIIFSGAPDAGKFKRALNEERAAGFPVDWTNGAGWTLLFLAVSQPEAIRAGLPQMLSDAGADVNIKDKNGEPPLGRACRYYIAYGVPEYLAAVNALLARGARSELDENWNEGWTEPDKRARRDWLVAYIDTWHERRAAAKRENAPAPSFDYAL